MGFLAGKRLLITGLLNNRSIAYGIAQACHREGAELAFSYQGERFKERITEFAAEFGSKLVFDWIAGHEKEDPNGEPSLVGGRLGRLKDEDTPSLLSNVVDGTWLPRPRTILVDSAALESGESSASDAGQRVERVAEPAEV